MSQPKERPILMQPEMIIAYGRELKAVTRRVIKPQPRDWKPSGEVPPRWGDRPKLHPAPYFDAYCNAPVDEANPRRMSEHWCWWDEYDRQGPDWIRCPYGKPGDRLWFRETWCETDWKPGTANLPVGPDGYIAAYRADYHDNRRFPAPWTPEWKSSRFMPRWASRYTPLITSIGAERVQAITRESAIAEGFQCLTKDNGRTYKYGLAEADGWPGPAGWHWQDWEVDPIVAYAKLWDQINGKPKPMTTKVDGRKVVDHYVSYPWEDVQETREHRGKPWIVMGNPWVWVVGMERYK
ncbi:MAG: hypothetical protein ACO1SV_21855 [Fimbriimonas sp.]